jgi:hypothetical protein
MSSLSKGHQRSNSRRRDARSATARSGRRCSGRTASRLSVRQQTIVGNGLIGSDDPTGADDFQNCGRSIATTGARLIVAVWSEPGVSGDGWLFSWAERNSPAFARGRPTAVESAAVSQSRLLLRLVKEQRRMPTYALVRHVVAEGDQSGRATFPAMATPVGWREAARGRSWLRVRGRSLGVARGDRGRARSRRLVWRFSTS